MQPIFVRFNQTCLRTEMFISMEGRSGAVYSQYLKIFLNKFCVISCISENNELCSRDFVQFSILIHKKNILLCSMVVERGLYQRLFIHIQIYKQIVRVFIRTQMIAYYSFVVSVELVGYLYIVVYLVIDRRGWCIIHFIIYFSFWIHADETYIHNTLCIHCKTL